MWNYRTIELQNYSFRMLGLCSGECPGPPADSRWELPYCFSLRFLSHLLAPSYGFPLASMMLTMRPSTTSSSGLRNCNRWASWHQWYLVVVQGTLIVVCFGRNNHDLRCPSAFGQYLPFKSVLATWCPYSSWESRFMPSLLQVNCVVNFRCCSGAPCLRMPWITQFPNLSQERFKAYGTLLIDCGPRFHRICIINRPTWVDMKLEIMPESGFLNLDIFLWFCYVLQAFTLCARCHPAGAFSSPPNMPQKFGTRLFEILSFWVSFRGPRWVHVKFCYFWFVALNQIGMSIRMANAVCMCIRICLASTLNLTSFICLRKRWRNTCTIVRIDRTVLTADATARGSIFSYNAASTMKHEVSSTVGVCRWRIWRPFLSDVKRDYRFFGLRDPSHWLRAAIPSNLQHKSSQMVGYDDAGNNARIRILEFGCFLWFSYVLQAFMR